MACTAGSGENLRALYELNTRHIYVAKNACDLVVISQPYDKYIHKYM